MGGRPRTLNSPLSTTHKIGCPILATSLFLSLGWETTNPQLTPLNHPRIGVPRGPSHLGTRESTTLNSPISTTHKIGCPIHSTHSVEWVGKHNPQRAHLNHPQNRVPRGLAFETRESTTPNSPISTTHKNEGAPGPSHSGTGETANPNRPTSVSLPRRGVSPPTRKSSESQTDPSPKTPFQESIPAPPQLPTVSQPPKTPQFPPKNTRF